MNFLITLCILAFTLTAKAEVDSVSVREMKVMFYEHYLKGLQPDTLFDRDIIQLDEPFTYPNNYVLNGTLLRKAGDIKLPPSKYLLYSNNRDTTATERLYWIGFRHEDKVKNAAKLKSKLIHQFGSVKVKDSINVVPATWVTGKICGLYFPFNYGMTSVSYNVWAQKINQGIAKKRTYPYEEVIDLGKSSLKNDAVRIVRGDDNPHFSVIHLDGGPRSKIGRYRQARTMSNRELILFAKDVSRLCTPQSNSDTEYSLLFYFDAHRKVHVEVLLPQKLSDAEKKRISELTKAIDQQPPQLFRSSFTIDGRVFPGIYVKASDTKNGWFFRDYRFEKDDWYSWIAPNAFLPDLFINKNIRTFVL